MGILDLFKLDGKVGLVTGAGQGIGRAYALALAEAGADVAVVDINDKTGRSVADEIASLGRGALYVRADVSKPEEIEAMVAATEARFGGLVRATRRSGRHAGLLGLRRLQLRDRPGDRRRRRPHAKRLAQAPGEGVSTTREPPR